MKQHMKNNLQKSLRNNLILVLGLSAPGLVVANPMGPSGPRSGGGGFVVSCPATKVSAASVELLDLYEMKQKGHKLHTSQPDLRSEYTSAVGRLNALLGAPDYLERHRESSDQNLTRFFQSIRWVRSSRELIVAEDLGRTPSIPSQCRFEQIAYFDDVATTIYVAEDLFEKLSVQDQAALVMHELFFMYSRQQNEVTSESARRLTGLSFVTTKLRAPEWPEAPGVQTLRFSQMTAPPDAGKNGEGFSWDVRNASELALFQDAAGSGTVLLFKEFFGRPVLAETAVVLPTLKLEFENIVVNTPPVPRVVRVIKTPGVNLDVRAAVKGEAYGGLGYEIRLHGQTGSSLMMELWQNGRLLQSSSLDR